LEATAQSLSEPSHAPVEAREFAAAPVPVKPVYEVPASEARAPREPEFTPPPVKPAPEAPAPREPDPAEIERALRDSGLEMVQTRAAGPIELPPDAEFVPAKRERRPPPPDINEPLVQVETSREPSEPKR
jgi:ribonuclease E